MHIFDISKAETIIGYSFQDKSLLTRAFTHSSFSNENKQCPDYERLEFLGDAILGLSVGLRLYKCFPTYNEGQLTKKRAELVSAETLSEIIDEYGLIDFMKVGTGHVVEEVKHSDNVKCDLFESIVGALYLDSGNDFSVAEKFIWTKLEKCINKERIDFKSKTLEYCAKNKIKCTISTRPEQKENAKTFFKCELLIDEKVFSEGEGKSKHEAEKNACKVFYSQKIEI